MKYTNLEIDFVERTLKIMNQYDNCSNINNDEKSEVTLLVNSLLGLIILPKEKSLAFIPKENFIEDIGLINSCITEEFNTLKKLITALRDSIAHFNIEFTSNDITCEIEKIIFYNDKKNSLENPIAIFDSKELRKFITYYSELLINKIRENYEKR